jgi:hypothetical protein
VEAGPLEDWGEVRTLLSLLGGIPEEEILEAGPATQLVGRPFVEILAYLTGEVEFSSDEEDTPTDPVVPAVPLKSQRFVVDGKLQNADGTGGLGMVLHNRGKDKKAFGGSLSVLLVRLPPL